MTMDVGCVLFPEHAATLTMSDMSTSGRMS
jgi:hypothetical protein